MSSKRPCTRTVDILMAVVVAITILGFLSVAFGAEVPEFPFKNTAQTGGVPGWTQTGAQVGSCAGVEVFLLQFTNPEGQLLQIFSDAQAKIVGAWYPEGYSPYPTHIWLGTINSENGKITMGPPVPFDPQTFPTPCVYWRGQSGA
jgi:hypothetical protein